MHRLVYFFVSVIFFIPTDCFMFSFTENNCSFVHYNLCEKNSSSFKKIFTLTAKCALKMGKGCDSFLQERIFEFTCSNPIESCGTLKSLITCQDTVECLFPLFHFAYSANAFIPVPDYVIANNVYKRIKCVNKNAKDKDCYQKMTTLRPPSEPSKYVDWVYSNYFNILKSLSWCDPHDSFDGECVRLLTLKAPACVFNDEASQVTLKRIFEKMDDNTSKVIVTDRAVSYEDFCQGHKESQAELGKVLKGGCETETQIEGQVHHLVCTLKDTRYVLLMQAMAKKLITSASDEMNKCIFEKAGPVPDDKNLFINWFCKRNYKVFKLDGNIHSVIRSCDNTSKVNTDSCDKSWHLFSVSDAFPVKIRQLMCLQAKDIAFDVTFDLWKYKQELPGRVIDFTNCTSMVNASAVKMCYNKIGKLSGNSDPTRGEDFEKAYCSSNGFFDTFMNDLLICLKEQQVSQEVMDICSRYEKKQQLIDTDFYECARQINNESTERCLELFVKDRTNFSEEVKKKPLPSDYLVRCIKYSLNEEYRKKLFGVCMAAKEAKDKLAQEKKKICVEKDAQMAYKFFWTASCVFAHSRLDRVLDCYNTRFGKVLPNLNEVRRIRDWFCKQENTALEMAKIKSCFIDRFILTTGFFDCISRNPVRDTRRPKRPAYDLVFEGEKVPEVGPETIKRVSTWEAKG